MKKIKLKKKFDEKNEVIELCRMLLKNGSTITYTARIKAINKEVYKSCDSSNTILEEHLRLSTMDDFEFLSDDSDLIN